MELLPRRQRRYLLKKAIANNSNNEVNVNEKKPEKKKNRCQNSVLGREAVHELELRVRAANMKRTTAWGLTQFEKWRDKWKTDVDLKTILPST